MKEIFEAFLGIFFIMLEMVTGMSVIAASITAKNADANLSAYVAEIEESNFAKSVVAAVFEDAYNRGYDITMVFYTESETGAMKTYSCSTSDLSPFKENNSDRWVINSSQLDNKFKNTGMTFADVYMIQIKLSFDYNFSLYNNVTPHVLYRFAR